MITSLFLSGTLALGSVTPQALAMDAQVAVGSTKIAQIDSDENLVSKASEVILEGFRILDAAIQEDSNGDYYLDRELLQEYSVPLEEIAQAEFFVQSMNEMKDDGKPLYRERSWTSFGMCVVGGCTGVQVNEIRQYVDWKTFGTFVKSKDWKQALNLLKAGVRTYMVKHGAQAAGRVALKQIINASGVGFAAQAGAAAIGCAALEGWRWIWR